jgi:hypothetical protein
MFRGKNQLDGQWVTQEFRDEEMTAFLIRVAKFNKEAWSASVRMVEELIVIEEIKSDDRFEAVKAFFDKLALNTFSVVHNQSQNLRD